MVKVQHLATLDNAEKSTVVISNSSKLSKIAERYHAFVQTNSGIINSFSGSAQSRLTLSAEIDQGSSWQLGVLIAHLLFNNSRLAMGDVLDGDEIIIATGEVNVATLEVSQINHLAQKCFRAANQISQLYPQTHMTSFFVPGENYRQPLPDVDMVLTPVDSIPELITFFARLGVCNEKLLVEKLERTPNLTVREGIEIIAVKKNNKSFAAICVAIVALFAVILFYFLSPAKPAMYEKRVGVNGCIEPDENVYYFDLHESTELPALFMHGLCSLEFAMPDKYQSAFVVSANGAFLQLNKTSSKRWHLPAPENKNQSRRYLVAFMKEPLDLADIQTLKSIAAANSELGEAKRSINNWALQKNTNIFIMQHNLR